MNTPATVLEPPTIRDVDAINTMAAMQKTAMETQFEFARQYPRDQAKSIKDATALATQTEEIAQASIYKLPARGQGEDRKEIEGPSVRLAEIIASTWGHLLTEARVLLIGDKEITAEGRCMDMQTGNAVSIQVRRRITTSKGHRYSDDMITVTGNAAVAIAFRNAVFKIVPGALVQGVYLAAKEKALGDPKDLVKRRTQVVERLKKNLGITTARILLAVGVEEIDDIDRAKLEILVGFGSAVYNGDMGKDEVFPVPGAKKTDELNAALDAAPEPDPKAKPPAAKGSADLPSAATEQPQSATDEQESRADAGEGSDDTAPQPESEFSQMKNAVVDALMKKAAMGDRDEAISRLLSYARKKFPGLNELTIKELAAIRTDIKIVVDIGLIK